MRDPEEATDGPPDPGLHPENSPGFDADPDGLEDIEVDRDVTIGEASLAELAVSDTEPVEDDALADLLDSLADGSVVARRRAALALAERTSADEDATQVVTALARAATTDEDGEVRQFAVEALAKHGGREAGDVARRLTDDPEPWVRAEAVVALDRLDRAEYAETITEALSDEHHAVRRNALVSLFKRRGEDALPVLLVAVDDESERVREWATHLLGGVDDERAESALREAAETDESGIVRKTAERSLSVDAGSFRRQFSGTLDETDQPLPGEDALNRTPDL
ncbi:HEAT repeat domain-containing protein [Salinirubrum litoreum]|uniref:HEAT repeat domain-containing protein n=1 Tax=Salinirubrum litoreum TaxID=1126234 RepID=A0ABD5RC51_9EURY